MTLERSTGRNRSWRPAKVIGIVALFVVLAAGGLGVWVLDRLGHPPKAYRFLIPEDHVGWFVVEFGDPVARPLPVEDGWHVVVVPVEGTVRTSDAMIGGGTMSDPLYVSRGGVVRGPATMRRGFTSQEWQAINANSPRITAYEFVGEPADADAWTERKDEKGNPIPGLRPRGTGGGPGAK
jgi:hypothetical protein